MTDSSPLRVKYPRTPHLPDSPGMTSDDKLLTSLDVLAGGDVIVTEKRDGEATTLYPDGYSHARSLDSAHHPSRSRIRALAAQVAAAGLPATFRLCGENLYATHSIRYTDLASFFELYSIWDDERCLHWSQTEQWATLLEIPTVPVLYTGPMLDVDALVTIWQDSCAERVSEGFVVRSAAAFDYNQFGLHVAKWVRAQHVRTDQHWMHAQLRINQLRSDSAD